MPSQWRITCVFVLCLQILIGVGCQTTVGKGGEATDTTTGSVEAASGSSLDLSSGRLPILQGSTTPNMTQVSVLVPRDEQMSFVLRERITGRLLVSQVTGRASREFSPWVAVTVQFTDLKPEESYDFEVRDAKGRVRDSRILRSLQIKSPNEIRFALISCMSDQGEMIELQKKMWPEAWEQKPNVLFLIGDNVYADIVKGRFQVADPRQIWERYVETRRHLFLYRMPELIPAIATWDDHDTGYNDGNRTFAHMAEAAAIFTAFFAQKPVPSWMFAGPGLAREYRVAGQSFFFLDNRSFRTPNLNPRLKPGQVPVPPTPAERAAQSHLGAEQEAWLNARMKETSGPAWLISGDQFFGAYHPFESYEGSHPEDFQRFLKALKKSLRPIIFLSGDRHLVEIAKVDKKVLGYPTYELTSSAIHAPVFKGAFRDNPNPRQLVGRDGIQNYMILTGRVRPDKKGVLIQSTAYGPGREVLFTQELDVKR